MANDVNFTCPTIGPKVYITKGPAGWIETFKRAEVDRELSVFVAPVPVENLVELFVTTRDLAATKRPTDWFTIVGFLARTMNCTPKLVPPTVGVAFWAHIVIATTHGAN